MIGALFAVMSAFSLGIHNAVARRGIITGTALQALSISLLMGLVVCFAATLALGQLNAIFDIAWVAIAWFFAAGAVQFLIARNLLYRATAAMGSNLTSTVMQSEMLFALAISMVVLGERLTPLRIFGLILLFIGPLLLLGPGSGEKNQSSGNNKDAWQPNYVEGFIFSLLSAAGYGASFVLAKLGMNAVLSAENVSVLGSLISFMAATSLLGVYLVLSGEWKKVTNVEPGPLRYFLFASLMAGVAVVFRYVALALAPVSVVAPLKRLSAVATILFSTLLNRQYEVISPRVIIAALLSLAGAICLALSTELVVRALGLPDWISDLLRWSWP